MALSNKHSREQGFLLIDVLIGLFVASIITAAFLGSVVAAVRYASMQTKAVQAELLAIEMVEVARELEKSTAGWNELTSGVCDTACHPDIEGGEWTLVHNATTTQIGFTRSMTIKPVHRVGAIITESENDDDIDHSTKYVEATVSWQAYGETRYLPLQTYVYEYVSALQ